MRHSFDWTYRHISAKEYSEKLGIPKNKGECQVEIKVKRDKNANYKLIIDSDVIERIMGSSKNATAYKVAEDVRKFEIDKYWQRTLYFWGIITAIYVAYFNVLKELCCSDGFEQQIHGTIPLVVLSALGTFFCFSWFLASKGSKHWQENWENHIDMLENEITGPLFKIHKHASSYSVSKINIMAGCILSLCSFCLFIFESFQLIQNCMPINGVFSILILTLVILAATAVLFFYAKYVKGNKKEHGQIDFDYKEFKEMHEE